KFPSFVASQIHLTRGYNIIEDVPCGLFALLPRLPGWKCWVGTVDLPWSFFRICNSVTALMLENTTIVAPTELPLSPLSGLSRPHIESLKMWNCHVRVPSLNLDMDFSHLRELDLRKVYLYHGDLSDFIRSVSGQLSSSRSIVSPQGCGLPFASSHLIPSVYQNPIDLAQFPVLTHIEWHEHASHFDMPSILERLRTLPSDNRVEIIVLWTTTSAASSVPRDFEVQMEALEFPVLQRAEVRLCRVKPAEALVRRWLFNSARID
ncbi:hypothetical protein B0H14DRAFT_2864712, partial [Mycena olivaceomarginata]